MASTPRTSLRRLRLAVAGGVALVALTVATAGASAATPAGTSGPALARPGTGGLAGGPGSGLRARSGPATGPRTPIPGYLLQRGRYLKFDAPDAVQQTAPFGINNRGVIVGKYTDAAGVDHGFRRDARGRFVTIDVPGGMPTQANKINDRGQIVGRYQTIPGIYSFRGC